MINIRIGRNQKNQIYSCEVKGHAYMGEKGLDIVCSAVSALTQTALLGLGKYLAHPLAYDVRDGSLVFTLTEPPNEKTDAILETMLLGLLEIAGSYRKNVKIEQYRG